MSSLTLGFELEWFDTVARTLKTLFLKYFLDDSTIEILVDKKAFLKRIYCAEVQITDLFVGNSISIFNRLLIIKKYANSATEKYMTDREIHFMCFIDSSRLRSLGQIFSLAKQFRLRMGRVKSTSSGDTFLEFVTLDGPRAAGFVAATDRLASTASVTVEELADVMGSDTVAVSSPCTLCLIKPHVIRSMNVGPLLDRIVEGGFTIAGVYSFHFSQEIADEFLDVYRDIYTPYSGMLDQICSSPVLAVMVTGGEFVVEDFRQLAGPLNPEIAKTLRPESLRALFGEDLVRNAVHCTDLPEDGEMECKFVFDSIGNL